MYRDNHLSDLSNRTIADLLWPIADNAEHGRYFPVTNNRDSLLLASNRLNRRSTYYDAFLAVRPISPGWNDYNGANPH